MTSDPVERFFIERSARLNRRARLRTMTGSEIIDTSIRVYQQLGWTFLRATILPTFFAVSAIAFVKSYILPSLFSTSDAGNLTTQFSEVAFAVGLAIFVGGPLLVVGVSASTAIVTQLVSDYMIGNVPTADGALRTAFRTLGSLVKVHFWELLLSGSGLIGALALSALSSLIDRATVNENALAGIVALLAIGSMIVGGFIFLVVVSRHALAAPAAVLENLEPRAAAKRSVQLMKGQGPIISGYGNVWGLYIVLLVVSIVANVSIYGFLSMVGFPSRFESYFDNLPMGGLVIEALGLVPMFLWVWTLVPVWAVTVTIIYYERRIRLEGYDIEALAGDVWRSDRQNRFEL